jgi:DNA modification methylase
MIIDSLKNLAVPIENLQALPGNPRLGDVDAVAKSLERFGQRKPIVARKDDGVIIAGNHTWQAAKKLGWTEIAVAFVGDDDVTAKAYALADNRTAELGSYDEQALIDLIEEVHAVVPEFVRDAGWSEEAVKELVAKIESEQPLKEIDEDEIPEPPVEPITKLGDIWQLGRHRLMCGDSTDEAQVKKLMNGEKADMVLTDPPYGINVVSKNGKIGSDNLAKNNIYAPIAGDNSIDVAVKAIQIIDKVLQAKIQIIWGGNYYANYLPNVASWIVWDKRGEMASNNFADCELAWCNTGSPARIYKQIWSGMIKEGESEKRVHPTQKPIKLSEWCINEYGKNLTNIVDLFAGSGSTLIACELKLKNGFIMELSPNYCDVIIKRWENLTGEKAVLVSNAESAKA